MLTRRKSRREPESSKIAAMSGRVSKSGLVQVAVMLRAEDLDALRAEAVRRMIERKAGRADMSEVLREVIAPWVAKQTRRAK